MEQDHIELEDFDREYGLPDLFPTDLAMELLSELDGAFPAAIFLPDGGLHYGPATAAAWSVMEAGHTEAIGKSGYALRADAGGSTAIFALTHEMETIGYLALRGGNEPVDKGMLQIGRFLQKAVHRLIHYNYKNHLTAGLHGRVVADSYASLKEKNVQLRQSEEKYRRLAEDLEIEVARQTEEIRNTQLAMMQQEKLASIGQLAAGVAHEINNPIGFVISNLNTLKSYAVDISRLIQRYRDLRGLMAHGRNEADAIEPILNELESAHEDGNRLDIDYVLADMEVLTTESIEGAERVKKIVHDLREFARPSIEGVENADIHHCLDTALRLLSSQIDDNIRVERIYGDLPPVRCRLREINQVFFHVLRNALQAVGDRGDRGDITIHTEAIDRCVVEVTITDTGAGIPAALLPRIFEPFFTTRDVGAGTGLGLNLAYNLIKRIDGTIAVRSEEGAGSTFTISIPIGGANTAAEGDVAEVHPSAGHKKVNEG